MVFIFKKLANQAHTKLPPFPEYFQAAVPYEKLTENGELPIVYDSSKRRLSWYLEQRHHSGLHNNHQQQQWQKEEKGSQEQEKNHNRNQNGEKRGSTFKAKAVKSLKSLENLKYTKSSWQNLQRFQKDQYQCYSEEEKHFEQYSNRHIEQEDQKSTKEKNRLTINIPIKAPIKIVLPKVQHRLSSCKQKMSNNYEAKTKTKEKKIVESRSLTGAFYSSYRKPKTNQEIQNSNNNDGNTNTVARIITKSKSFSIGRRQRPSAQSYHPDEYSFGHTFLDHSPSNGSRNNSNNLEDKQSRNWSLPLRLSLPETPMLQPTPTKHNPKHKQNNNAFMLGYRDSLMFLHVDTKASSDDDAFVHVAKTYGGPDESYYLESPSNGEYNSYDCKRNNSSTDDAAYDYDHSQEGQFDYEYAERRIKKALKRQEIEKYYNIFEFSDEDKNEYEAYDYDEYKDYERYTFYGDDECALEDFNCSGFDFLRACNHQPSSVPSLGCGSSSLSSAASLLDRYDMNVASIDDNGISKNNGTGNSNHDNNNINYCSYYFQKNKDSSIFQDNEDNITALLNLWSQIEKETKLGKDSKDMNLANHANNEKVVIAEGESNVDNWFVHGNINVR